MSAVQRDITEIEYGPYVPYVPYVPYNHINRTMVAQELRTRKMTLALLCGNIALGILSMVAGHYGLLTLGQMAANIKPLLRVGFLCNLTLNILENMDIRRQHSLT